MKKILAGLMLVASVAASAKEVTFTFDINSSGPDIYPCNVGLRHVKRGSQVVRPVGSNVVIATNDKTGLTSGDQLPDFFSASYGNWDGLNVTGAASANVRNSYTNDFATLFGNGDITNTAVSNGKILTALTFNLGSERFGAEFFVDVCYRRPNFAYNGVSGLNFVANAWASLTDHVADAYSYTTLSGLKVKSKLYCKTGDAELTSYVYEGSEAALVSSFQSTLNNITISGVPNHCIVRFSFNESNVNNERIYQTHGATAKVKAEISEPGADEVQE